MEYSSKHSKENYVIAIPSYNREENIKKATLNMLDINNIDPSRVYIFVANNSEKMKYKKSLNNGFKNYGQNIIVGELGVMNIRNFMANYFEEGQYVFYLDDDMYRMYKCIFDEDSIKKVSKKLKDKGLKPNETNFKKWMKTGNRLELMKKGGKVGSIHDFIIDGFTECEERGMRLFGIHPVDNPFFLTPKHMPGDEKGLRKTKNLSEDLRYIEGGACGAINCKEAELRTVHDKEDYERSIKYYLLDGGVIRFNNVCAYTKCYREPGGLQSTGHRTWEKVDKSAKFLAAAYPELTTLNTKKKNADKKTGKSWTEVKLRDKRKGNNRKFGSLTKISKKLYKELNELKYN
jgi:hypothetical protein